MLRVVLQETKSSSNPAFELPLIRDGGWCSTLSRKLCCCFPVVALEGSLLVPCSSLLRSLVHGKSVASTAMNVLVMLGSTAATPSSSASARASDAPQDHLYRTDAPPISEPRKQFLIQEIKKGVLITKMILSGTLGLSTWGGHSSVHTLHKWCSYSILVGAPQRDPCVDRGPHPKEGTSGCRAPGALGQAGGSWGPGFQL